MLGTAVSNPMWGSSLGVQMWGSSLGVQMTLQGTAPFCALRHTTFRTFLVFNCATLKFLALRNFTLALLCASAVIGH